MLVANAKGGRGRPVDTKATTLDPALMQLITEMNLSGTIHSCNAVAPIVKRQRSGKIITVGSVAGTTWSADGGGPPTAAMNAGSPYREPSTRAGRIRLGEIA